MIQDRIVRDPEATKISGISKSQRHVMTAAGKFPKKVKISTRASGYLLSELQAWLESRPRTDSQQK